MLVDGCGGSKVRGARGMSPADAREPDPGSTWTKPICAAHKAIVAMVLLPLLLGRRLSFAPATAEFAAAR